MFYRYKTRCWLNCDSTNLSFQHGGIIMQRGELLERVRKTPKWDLIVIGGGATGLGIAVDAAARGYTILLLEAHDFAKSTSSRSTKLVHGGVRYLAQGNVALVYEALQERGRLHRNAPHLSLHCLFSFPVIPGGQTHFMVQACCSTA
jgi:glycerol-3-phosphate dehydrogenase